MNKVIWITGNTQAGKTFTANALKNAMQNIKALHIKMIDGDELRASYKEPLSLSKSDRIKNNVNAAKLAKEYADKGYWVIVSLICPYKFLRKKVKNICNCKFIYIEGGLKGKEYPYDHPTLY